MTTPLFSTYRQGENRVTASTIAVLQRLSLPNIDRILGALLGETDFSLVSFENQPKAKESTPDARIGTGRDIWIETKTERGASNANQLKRHLTALRGDERLLLLTPDADKPVDLPQDDRLVWANFSTLSATVSEILRDEQTPPSEREAFLLRELNILIDRERLLVPDKSNVLVIAARVAWPDYNRLSIYRCQPRRSFRPSDYLAFYAEGAIQPRIAKIKFAIESIDMRVAEEVESLEENDPAKGAARELYKRVVGEGLHSDFGAQLKIMFLTAPDDEETIRLQQPIANDKKDSTGKPTPFTYGAPRYVTVESLMKASKTSELEIC